MKGRPPIPARTKARVLRLLASGMHSTEVAEQTGLSPRSVYNIRKAAELAGGAATRPAKAAKTKGKAPAAPTAVEPADDFELDGDALAMARQLLDRTGADLGRLKADSPRIGGARTEARNLVKLVNQLERERAAVETDEERATRLRREDAEVRTRIMRYVEQHEAAARKPTKAAPHGSCCHCGSALTAEQARALYGEPGA